MSTEWAESGVDIDIWEKTKSSPSYEMVQALVKKWPNNHPSRPDRSVFSVKFIPAPGMQITNPNGLVGFIEIGETFKISDYLKSNTRAPVGPDGQQPLTAEDVRQEDNVSKVLNLVFQNHGPQGLDQFQRQLGISDVKLPVFIRDELTDQDFPPRHTTDKLILDCINYQAEELKRQWGKTQEEMTKRQDRMLKGAEERLEKGISFRSTEDTIREYGGDIGKKLSGILASAFTASAHANFHILQTAKYMDSIDQYRAEFEEYSKIIPDTAKKVKEVYLSNHYVYDTLRGAVENSIKNPECKVSDELKEFFEEAKALNNITIDWTDQKQHAVNAVIKSLFYQKIFDVHDQKILPFEGVFKHLEELHNLVKGKPPLTAAEAQAEEATKAQALEAHQTQFQIDNESNDLDEDMTIEP